MGSLYLVGTELQLRGENSGEGWGGELPNSVNILSETELCS